MDHINLNNMFPSANDAKSGNLTIDALFKPANKEDMGKVHFDIDKLHKQREDMTNKVVFQYRKMFNICLEKIKSTNKFNKSTLLYEIPKLVYMQNNYDSAACLDFIQDKLNKLNIYSQIVSDTAMFIDWTNAHQKHVQ